MLLAMALLFGTLAAIFGIILWFAAPSIGLVQGFLWVVVFVAVVVGLQWYFAPSLIKAFTRMREAPRDEYPWLHEMVEELSRAAGIPKPRVYVVQDATPNAFAFGRTPASAHVAVHTGLLNVLNKDEIRAVVAHEIGHIKHWDVVVITLASMVPLIVYYSIVLLGSLFLARGREEGGGFPPLMVWVGGYVAQFFSMLIVMHLSRSREYYADAFSAVAMRNPTALQTALAKIVYGFPASVRADAYRDKRAFYIADPVTSAQVSRAVSAEELGREVERSEEQRVREPRKVHASEVKHAIEWERTQGAAKIIEFFGTHPLTFKRIDALEELRKPIESGELTLAQV